MDPKRKEERTSLIDEGQEVFLPTDEVQTRDHEQDDYYESPVDFEGFYSERIELRG